MAFYGSLDANDCFLSRSSSYFERGVGGIFTLSAIYRLKSPELGYKVGVKRYQNSSWDIWSRAKQFSGPKSFLSPTPRPAGKMEYPKIWNF